MSKKPVKIVVTKVDEITFQHAVKTLESLVGEPIPLHKGPPPEIKKGKK